MADITTRTLHGTRIRDGAIAPSRLPVLALGTSLSAFLAITYMLCVLYHIVFPNQTVTEMWFAMFPGFTWLNWQSFVLGLIESAVYGWYAALVFGPLYNFFATRWR
jgi:uncharacterized protein DUF5676